MWSFGQTNSQAQLLGSKALDNCVGQGGRHSGPCWRLQRQRGIADGAGAAKHGIFCGFFFRNWPSQTNIGVTSHNARDTRLQGPTNAAATSASFKQVIGTVVTCHRCWRNPQKEQAMWPHLHHVYLGVQLAWHGLLLTRNV